MHSSKTICRADARARGGRVRTCNFLRCATKIYKYEFIFSKCKPESDISTRLIFICCFVAFRDAIEIETYDTQQKKKRATKFPSSTNLSSVAADARAKLFYNLKIASTNGLTLQGFARSRRLHIFFRQRAFA